MLRGLRAFGMKRKKGSPGVNRDSPSRMMKCFGDYTFAATPRYA